jgi:hypothetical protein
MEYTNYFKYNTIFSVSLKIFLATYLSSARAWQNINEYGLTRE